jgi:UDP-hydrolysing UDP-N-acetyl-D-glucosamine 2-epimerase
MTILKNDPRVAIQVAVTGSHFAPEFGRTIDDIHADGFTIHAEAPCFPAYDAALSVAEAVASALGGLARAFSRMTPDLVVVLGDRFETLAAAQAALLMHVPIAHVHGGELTEGMVDDAIRHAITKMASLHFVAAPAYAGRVIQMGEAPERVFLVGSPGVEAALSLERTPATVLDKFLGLPLRDPVFLVTLHPDASQACPEETARALLTALDAFPAARVVMTGVNADVGYSTIVRELAEYARKRSDRVTLHASLGQIRYLSVMARAAVVVGNSSSGLIEAPALGVPTVNIGDRQVGRLRAPSVIDSPARADAIVAAIATALDPEFRVNLRTESPYGSQGGTSAAIADALISADLEQLRIKRFYDQDKPKWQ